MRLLDKMYIRASFAAKSAVENFVKNEEGDTNFISMLLIIGIVVVLAGAFLTLGNKVMSTVDNKVTNFVTGL